MPQLNPEIARAHEVILAHYNNPQTERERDYTRTGQNKDFREMAARLAAAKKAGKLSEELNTALGTSDFGETHDLPLEEPDGFWDKIMDESLLLAQVATRFTDRKSITRNELTLGANGEDIVRPGVAGTDPGDTVTADTALQTFTPQEHIVIVDITDDVLEDNLEGAGLEAHLMGMLQRALANEMEFAFMNGEVVGSSNSDRSSITGMYNGWLDQYMDGGAGVVYATAYDDRYVSAITENDKHAEALKALPTKYRTQGKYFISPRDIILDYAQVNGERQTPLGDRMREGGLSLGVRAFGGVDFFECNAFRLNHLVKGTGTVQASSPVDTTLSAICKSRQATMTLTSATNEADNNRYVIGCDAAGTSFDLTAEKCVQVGAAVGSVITVDDPAAFVRDHASGTIVTEYSADPDADGVPNLLSAFDNLGILSHRALRIEPYRLPRLRTTCFVITFRACPFVLNPADGVIIRDLKVR